MTATGSNTSNKFKAARQNKEFVQDVNSDAADSAPKQITITSRNKSQVTLEPNTLSQRERSRVKNGRTWPIQLLPKNL